MQMEIGWHFPPLNGGIDPGFNEMGGRGHFSDELADMVREVIQNSLDAHAVHPPVTVCISCVDVPRNKFPGADDLARALEGCRRDSSQDEPRAIQFFERASSIIGRARIPFLVVRDFNTTGVVGSELSARDKDNQWYRLVKRPGASGKEGDAGGSWGEGKFAAFAISELGTVFYGTRDEKENTALQGVAMLMSHRAADGRWTQATGFYGVREDDETKPILDDIVLHGEYRQFSREEHGTDVWIAGARLPSEWKGVVVHAVLDNFLPALWRGRLVVDVGGLVVNKEALPRLIPDLPPKDPTRAFWTALKEPGKRSIRAVPPEVGVEGSIELFLLVRPDMPKRVLVSRETGMKICTWDGRIVKEPTPFVGVLWTKGAGLNGILRKIEPPRHDDWNPKWTEEKDRPRARRVLEWLKAAVSEMIAEATDTGAESVPVAGLREYLWDDDEGGAGGRSAPGPVTIEKGKPPRAPGVGFAGSRQPGGGSGGGGGKGGRPGPGPNGGPDSPLEHAHVWCRNPRTGSYRVKLRYEIATSAYLRVRVLGEDGSQMYVPIAQATDADDRLPIGVSDGRAGPIALEAGGVKTLDLTLPLRGKYLLALSLEGGGGGSAA